MSANKASGVVKFLLCEGFFFFKSSHTRFPVYIFLSSSFVLLLSPPPQKKGFFKHTQGILLEEPFSHFPLTRAQRPISHFFRSRLDVLVEGKRHSIQFRFHVHRAKKRAATTTTTAAAAAAAATVPPPLMPPGTSVSEEMGVCAVAG